MGCRRVGGGGSEPLWGSLPRQIADTSGAALPAKSALSIVEIIDFVSCSRMIASVNSPAGTSGNQ